MALQVLKPSFAGSVDLTNRVVELPDPRPKHQPQPAWDVSWLDPRRLVMAGLPSAILTIVAVPAIASNTTLSSGDATATIDSTQGATGLTINGISELSLNEFFYRLGNGSGTITPITPTNEVSNIDGLGTFTYSDSNISATIVYDLDGGSGTDPAQFDQVLTLTNNTGSTQPIQLFDYTDFDLGGESANQSAEASGSPVNTIDQQNQEGTSASDSVGQQNTVAPSDYEITNSGALLTSLQNSTLTSLNNTTTSPGDINWAFEFDDSVGATDQMQVSLDSNITVPEPASAAIASTSLSSLLLLRRRKRAVA